MDMYLLTHDLTWKPAVFRLPSSAKSFIQTGPMAGGMIVARSILIIQ